MLSTPYFNEGWALYAERVMREQGFFTEPIQELYHLEATIFRAARIVVDTSLHLGEMTFDEAIDVPAAATGHGRADGTRRGRPLLRVADPGVVVPHRLPRDPAHPARWLEARGLGDVAPADVSPRSCASSTTPSPRRARCRWASRNG